jgi:adenosylcobinamide kinase / adenosylcobinamide-phosphate guanylyltransferase
MAEVTLITGGARSGKSSFALELALKRYSQRSFIATAVAVDEEMKERIAFHQRQRGNAFQNIEEPIRLSNAIASAEGKSEVAVVDCLTVWLGNLYHHYNQREATIREDITGLLRTLDKTACDLILVTNEVGWGIVPERPLGRLFRDMAGFMNRQVAQRAQHVYLLCCGIPITLKGESARE